MMLCGNRPLSSAGASPATAANTTRELSFDALVMMKKPTNGNAANGTTTKAQRQAAARTAAAKSKSKLWGPSHSFDSDDDDDDEAVGNLGARPREAGGGWWDTVNKAWTELGQSAAQVVHNANNTTSTWSAGNTNVPPVKRSRSSQGVYPPKRPMAVVPEEQEAEEDDSTDPSTQEDSQEQPSNPNHPQYSTSHATITTDGHGGRNHHYGGNYSQATTAGYSGTAGRMSRGSSRATMGGGASIQDSTAATAPPTPPSRRSRGGGSAAPSPLSNTTATTNASNSHYSTHERVVNKVEEWTDLFSNACGTGSPCSAQDLEDLFGRQQQQQRRQAKQNSEAGLGIAPMRLDEEDEEEDDNILTSACHNTSLSQINTSAESQQPTRQKQQTSREKPTTRRQAAAAATPTPPPPQRTLSEESPADRRRQRAAVRRQRHEDAARSVSGGQSVSSQQQQQQSSNPAHEDFEVTSQERVLITQPTTTSVLQSQSQLPPPSETILKHTPPPQQAATTQAHQQQQYQPPQPQPPEAPLPLETLLVREEEAAALERSISELTMRSSYQGEVTTRSNGRPAAPDQRRMAYYAVGRHHRLNSGPRSGGNRRCYFTGKLIFGGAPFYAGIVQQGLRTLVVFCLPSALGMPHNLPAFQACGGGVPKRRPSLSATTGTATSSGNRSSGLLQRSRRTLSSAASGSVALSKTPSKLSSTINLDEMSLSIEGDIDPNWNLDKDFLLGILPDPSEEVLAEMNQRYPEQFETLPVQVRHASCWRLFVKFCFFSGLPIAEGELHYQVRPSLALEMYGEEIVLSHDVMEAVNGASSAEILKLPNRKTFRYLKKHYPQQSHKLPEIVFQRASWEQVKAEV